MALSELRCLERSRPPAERTPEVKDADFKAKSGLPRKSAPQPDSMALPASLLFQPLKRSELTGCSDHFVL